MPHPSAQLSQVPLDRPVTPPAPSSDRVRICILCGGPLRAGQRMVRVHGTTIHARCGRPTR